MPIDVALDHGYAGLVSVVVEPSGETGGPRCLGGRRGAAGLLADGPVAACAQWKAVPRET
ncbi:MAG: hypothetical protein Ct9H300mP12_01190 [Acidimicrobiales bacterium]|nr:MAG: hypothetical protein Ct9H300mP12_01190 [Acidimicrobiales bacterium]